LAVFASAPKKKKKYFENLKNISYEPHRNSYNLKSLKISYANGRVSVRIFYENNLISFLSTRFLQE
jgi:hypothetical protein